MRKLLRVAAVFAAVAPIALGVMAQRETDRPSEDYRAYYVAREQGAPAPIVAELDKQRRKIKEEGLHFEVGFTTAMKFRLDMLAGARPPADIRSAASTQSMRIDPNVKSRRPASEEIAAEAKGLTGCIAASPQWDWRKANKVSRVRDQVDCGACWAFATASAIESGYLIRTNQTPPADLSEQYIVSCSGLGTCQGGWWAFDFAQDNGVASEASVPYEAIDGVCPKSVLAPFRVQSWGYVSHLVPIPSVEQIKEALCAHGPLVAAVNVTKGFQTYIGGVFDEHDLGTKTAPVNHAVTLIGWDDKKGAWLIKNSWGLGWGEPAGHGNERGYMWISYGSNNVGYGAAWVEVPIPKIAGEPPGKK
jgi:C1A family cysteine protease